MEADPLGLIFWVICMSKVAILIDAGFLLKRLPSVCPSVDHNNALDVANAISRLVTGHLKKQNNVQGAHNERSLLYRVFYYDAKPYMNKGHFPVSKKSIDYGKTSEAVFRLALFNELRKRANTAVRLGEVRKERSWILKDRPQSDLLNGKLNVSDLTDADFAPGLRQKAVDMRIGLDIASISLKQQAETIILVSGDADFVPAAKLARREGVKVILDPLWRSVAPDLYEHIDGVQSGFPKPSKGD